MFGFRKLRRRSFAAASKLPRWLLAHFTSTEPASAESGWWRADNLPADVDASFDTRRILRMRSRFEVQNNSYARCIVQTLAKDSVGSGPRLRFGADDDSLNTRIERDFAAWAEMIRLATKLKTIRIARCQDGEAFVILAQNPALRGPVQLDLQLIDADRVKGDFTPNSLFDDGQPLGSSLTVDGINFDKFGNPVSYCVAKTHPESSVGDPAVLVIPAANMLHVFNQDRPEQHRGVPELASALPLFAKLRRYTDAVVESAAKATQYGGVIYTDKPKEDTAAEIEPMDAISLEMNKLLTMPEGWKMNELTVKGAITTYSEFKKEILAELGSAVGIPYTIVAGTSAGYPFASAKLDHQTYYRSIWTERAFVEDQILNRLFFRWLREWQLSNPDADLTDALSPWKGSWIWPHTDDIDKMDAAKVQNIQLRNGTTTLANEYARQGKNWKTELAQLKAEQDYKRELGLTGI